jgi:hypothetical protein
MEQSHTEETPRYTPEQLKEMRDKSSQFFKEQIPVLKLTKEYESLLADIEEARLRKWVAISRVASMMAKPSEDPTKDPKKGEESND